ncbi:uncharacterized protein LOC124300994 [Neodiprion virginianus]|uniref:uncharacterized protein LOC124300994 n=1 Tax=Neodiprion virginianus TaxID=2961670 RepID=UPI001EE745D0|nr:uncharacterized protein LOC124300994 [Neodiprion virginianus]
MYKSAVILVALIGTACAFPPADILRKSVAEDNVDEKAPEIPSQGSEVENQKEDDGVRESDKKSTSEYRLFTATMTIPEFMTVTAIRSDQSAEENEEPKTSCAEGDASCDSGDENRPRQKRTIELFPLLHYLYLNNYGYVQYNTPIYILNLNNRLVSYQQNLIY